MAFSSRPQCEMLQTMFDQIEKLKDELTDKYVVITADRPELRRFVGYTGQVKTVNMSGRALVEFNCFNNIGWYDINPVYLRVVDKPVEGASAKQVEAKAAPAAKVAQPAAGEKKLSPLEMARMQGAAKPAGAAPAAGKPAAGKPSTADILAAARAKAGGAAPAAKATEAKAAAPTAAPAGEGKKLSTADILAAARAKKAAGEGGTADAASAEESPVEAPAEAAPVAAKPKAKPAASGALPTTTAEKIAWLRAHDSK